MRAATLILLTLSLSACSLVYPAYPIEAEVVDGTYSRSILESDGYWVVTKHFDSDIFYFTLSKTEAADLALDNQWFWLTAESSGYDVSLYPRQVQLERAKKPNINHQQLSAGAEWRKPASGSP
ncbi:hypothetical protein [Allomeiothermus silvanus]|uniref:hypothetical protein n=1 Tax=Allomeiothermus silvanus TaxID=52022 RepID=UPI0023F53D18|nr:hypothetical protein [Allomeiothermus silvanus]